MKTTEAILTTIVVSLFTLAIGFSAGDKVATAITVKMCIEKPAQCKIIYDYNNIKYGASK
jgi:hypothetical protein